MSLQSKISDLATRIGQECKALWSALAGKSDIGHNHDGDYAPSTSDEAFSEASYPNAHPWDGDSAPATKNAIGDWFHSIYAKYVTSITIGISGSRRTILQNKESGTVTDLFPQASSSFDGLMTPTHYDAVEDYIANEPDIILEGDTRLSDSREWTADTISQAEAEAGTSTTRRAWTAERVKQAMEALGGGVFVISGERNSNLTNGHYVAFGNGGNHSNSGVVMAVETVLEAISVRTTTAVTGDAVFEVYVNGSSISKTVTLLSGNQSAYVTDLNYSINLGDTIHLRCNTGGVGGTSWVASAWFLTNGAKGEKGDKGDDGISAIVTNTVTGDWNDIKTTGFFQGSGLTNECPGSSWRFCKVIRHNDLWVTQTMNDFGGTGMYQRNLVNNVWGSWRKLDIALGTTSGTACEGNDSRLSDTRTPADNSVTYAKVDGSLKDRVAETGTAIDWDDGQIHTKTLTANTTFTFSNLREGKVISLILTGNYTITWPSYMDADHLISGEYDGTTENYIQVHCTNDANGSEEVWWAIKTKGA